MKSINGEAFRRMLVCAANRLEANKGLVDSMNVFPVPDGDTGTNMSHTFTSAIKEVMACESSRVGEIAEALSKGALRGARGNSGVILSQLLRGMAKSLKEEQDIDRLELASAIVSGVDKAFKAVMKPKEGTILTVARAMSDAALALADEDVEIEDMLKRVLEEGKEVLAKTPDMLPVLKQAGVVDAGGQGLIFLYQGMWEALTNGSTECEPLLCLTQSGAPVGEVAKGPAQAAFDTESIVYVYCTEFIAEKVENAEAIEDELRSFLSAIGDSLVVVADGDLLKVHVHTNDPGLVLRKATSLGELTSVKIENMRLQHRSILEEASAEEKTLAPAAEPENNVPEEPHKDCGFVAVCAGPGLGEVLKGLGVDRIITGGQTMNPSTEDILKAAESVNADTVFVFPNNKNIILAARQAAEMVEDKRLIVIPTKSVPMAVTALLNYMPDPDPEVSARAMTDALTQVTDGSITFAVRDTVMGEFEIKENDLLAMQNGELVYVGKNLPDTAKTLMDSVISPESLYVNIYYGADVTEEDANVLADYVRTAHPEVEVQVVNGGQPLYYYIVSAE